MRAGIVRVGVLVWLPASGSFSRQPVRHLVVRPWVLGCNRGGTDNNLGAVRLEHINLVGADLVWTDEDAVVATILRDHGQTDAGVAAGGLDDRSARTENPCLLTFVDHPDGDAVLDAAARVEVLDFRQDCGSDALSHPAQLDQRRVADQAHDGVVITHSVSLVDLAIAGGRLAEASNPRTDRDRRHTCAIRSRVGSERLFGEAARRAPSAGRRKSGPAR